MNVVKKILCALVLVGGLSVASMAQKGGDGKKPPPKGNPPVIDPGKKPPPQNPPRGGDKPKKPGMAFIIKREESLIYLA
jgi:hypothetical protein